VIVDGDGMDASELKSRTKRFGLDVIKIVENLPNNQTANIIGRQLLRSSTSVGANYRAACRGRSKAEFNSKINISIEEADESLYWMEILVESGLISEMSITQLMREADELIAILTASSITARKNLKS